MDPSSNAVAATLGEHPNFLTEHTDAPVIVVEFFDFECPPCGYVAPLLDEVMEEFGDDVVVAARNLPLVDIHPNAMAAAQAAQAAAEQGTFADMYHRLFATQSEWAKQPAAAAAAVFRREAETAGLDLARWETDIVSARTSELISTDIADARALGAAGTPTIFVNGVLVKLASEHDLRNAVRAALNVSTNTPK